MYYLSEDPDDLPGVVLFCASLIGLGAIGYWLANPRAIALAAIPPLAAISATIYHNQKDGCMGGTTCEEFVYLDVSMVLLVPIFGAALVVGGEIGRRRNASQERGVRD